MYGTFFKKNGISCVVVDRSGNRRVLPPFLKNGLMEDGSYIYKGIRIIPDYNGAISVSVQKTDIILVDSGHSMRELEMIRILWILLLRIMHI